MKSALIVAFILFILKLVYQTGIFEMIGKYFLLVFLGLTLIIISNLIYYKSKQMIYFFAKKITNNRSNQ